ncbi:MAG: DUF1295 domain-containing protein [Bacteroidetes bacterium]|nr:MAG: DUF1295 domain-containing protein [Bacteroidota bacterium]
MENPYVLAAGAIFIYMMGWFIAAQIKKDNSIVDIAWGLGFVVVAWLVHREFAHPAQVALTGMVTLWGLRLAGYLWFRNRKTGEDWRYQKWRRAWGDRVVVIAFFRVFMLQGALMWLIALPVMQVPEAGENADFPAPVQWLGMAVFLAGWVIETLADEQLRRFKSKPENAGKVLRSGLWAKSRHPNYFGEIVVWWGIFLFVLPFSTWYVAVIGPAVITFFLMRVSGVPMLERRFRDNPDYEAYKKASNALWPF